MTITPFGTIFGMLGLIILCVRPVWLLPLLIVSSTMQAFAVAVIGPAQIGVGLGVTPWLFTSALIFIHFTALVFRRRSFVLELQPEVKLLFVGWMTLLGWSVLSAFTFPFIFKGIPVHPLSGLYGFDDVLKPLLWNRVGAVLAINACIIVMLINYILYLCREQKTNSILKAGLVFAIIASASFTLLHRVQLFGISFAPFNILSESINPSYVLARGSNFRAFFPFSESSYASVWYLGLFIAGLSLYLFTVHLWESILLTAIAFISLFFTLGGTGFAGLAIALPFLIIIALVSFSKSMISVKSVFVRLAALALLVALLAIAYQGAREFQPELPDFYHSLLSVIQERASGPIGFRGQSNLDALNVIRNTWGLGAGLGTNRASSYLLSMASTIGLPGLVLFLVLLIYQLRLLARGALNGSPLSALVLGGTIGTFSGLVVGIPDLLFPAWWVWLIVGFAIVASNPQTAASTVEAPASR